MESNDKMFIPITILAVIMLGIFIYLVFLDSKIRKIEKQLKEKNTAE